MKFFVSFCLIVTSFNTFTQTKPKPIYAPLQNIEFVWSENDYLDSLTGVLDTIIYQRFIVKSRIRINSVITVLSQNNSLVSFSLNQLNYRKGDTGVLTIKIDSLFCSDVISCRILYKSEGRFYEDINQPIGFDFLNDCLETKEPYLLSYNKSNEKFSGEIHFDSLIIDLGIIKTGEKITRIIKFKNIGDDILIPLGVRSSSGGLMASISREEIPPGELGELWIEFSAPDISLKKNDIFKIKKSISIKSSAKNQIVIKVVGEVVK